MVVKYFHYQFKYFYIKYKHTTMSFFKNKIFFFCLNNFLSCKIPQVLFLHFSFPFSLSYNINAAYLNVNNSKKKLCEDIRQWHIMSWESFFPASLYK